VALKAGPKSQVTTPLPRCASSVEFSELVTGPLYAWQAPILADLTADSRPRIAYVQVGRKNGKSRLGASLAIDEMCLRGGQVFLIADSERNLKSALFFELCTLIRNSPQLSGAVHIYKDHLECPETGGGVYLRPNNVGASQSINPDLVIFDEVHMQKNDQTWNGMALATAARPRGLLLGITTPGYDVTSMAHDLYVTLKAGTNPRLYGRIFEPEQADCALDDQTALVQANPVLIDRPDMAEVFDFERETLPEHDYRRFRLGQWTTAASAWLPYGAWDDRMTTRELAPGETIWVGFDGSYSGDSTALVACTADGFVQVLGCWENPGRKGWRVPRDAVDAAVAAAFATYDVREMLCDPPYWAREIADWEKRYPGKVIEFPTYVRARMAPACSTFYAGVVEGKLTHQDDPRLARHVSNAVVRSSPMGDLITKADKDSPAKIDLAVAAVIAYSRAVLAAPRRAPVFVR
jgi:phage terminase large subunit-like protein